MAVFLTFYTGNPDDGEGSAKFDLVPGAVGSEDQRNRVAFRLGCRLLFYLFALGLLDQPGPHHLLHRLCRRPRGKYTVPFIINFITSFLEEFLYIASLLYDGQVLATEWDVSGERKGLLPEERRTATDLQTLWDFEGILKYSPIFYGFYSNTYETNEGYKLPFAYFFTGLVLYMYSFVAILRKYIFILFFFVVSSISFDSNIKLIF